jgi:CheY-like chemotaxis protein
VPLILVVEDYVETRELYCELLESVGFRVAGAASGNEAVDQALKLVPDVILMDLSLPGMDGCEATRVIRRDPRLGRAAIVALTGHSTAGISKSALAAGCDALLTKPCSPNDLLAEIRRLLDAKTAP